MFLPLVIVRTIRTVWKMEMFLNKFIATRDRDDL